MTGAGAFCTSYSTRLDNSDSVLLDIVKLELSPSSSLTGVDETTKNDEKIFVKQKQLKDDNMSYKMCYRVRELTPLSLEQFVILSDHEMVLDSLHFRGS